jgi:hypothetical protein
MGLSYGMTAGDFDGNGTIDVMYTLSGIGLRIFTALNDGSGHFHVAQIDTVSGSRDATMKCADLNNDGTLDVLVTQYHDENLIVLHNDSTVAPVGITEYPKPQLQDCTLENISPDPVTHSATITFHVSAGQDVLVQVANINGEVITELIHSQISPGTHSVAYDFEAIPAGTYFVRLIAGQSSATKSFTVTH